MKHVLLTLVLLFLLPTSLFAIPQNIVEVQTIEFYDGISVTSMKMANGDFTALVSDTSVAADLGLDKSANPARVQARYDLRSSAKMGMWRVFPQGKSAVIERAFDYRASTNATFLDQLDSIIASHAVESIALSALWLYEDYLVEVDQAQEEFKALLTVPGLEKELRDICDDCTADTNGCSPGWIVPDECGGVNLFQSCNDHDSCYQCGATCSGTSRLQCDQGFRDSIAAAGSSLCAQIYYWGVRGLGFLFYQDPSVRPYMGPDVYALGISMSACEGQYAHMCTSFVM